MEFTMVSTAEWDSELIADSAPKRAALRELKMMRSQIEKSPLAQIDEPDAAV